MRDRFEAWVLVTRKQTQPYGLVERAGENGEKYLDLYTQKQWEGWQAALDVVSDKNDIARRELLLYAIGVIALVSVILYVLSPLWNRP